MIQEPHVFCQKIINKYRYKNLITGTIPSPMWDLVFSLIFLYGSFPSLEYFNHKHMLISTLLHPFANLEFSVSISPLSFCPVNFSFFGSSWAFSCFLSLEGTPGFAWVTPYYATAWKFSKGSKNSGHWRDRLIFSPCLLGITVLCWLTSNVMCCSTYFV